MSEDTNGAGIRDRLVAQRGHLMERIAGLEVAFRDLVDAATGTNIDDEHDPEGATIAFERAQVGALLDQSRQQLRDLDQALAEFGRKAYGICERCGLPIAPGRLAARPSARNCITCARRLTQ